MLKNQVCNSDTPSSKLLVDSQLFGLSGARAKPSSPVIEEDCLKTLPGRVQDSKKSQFTSNFTLFGAWLFLFITLAAMLAPIFNSLGQAHYFQQIEPEESGLIIPK